MTFIEVCKLLWDESKWEFSGFRDELYSRDGQYRIFSHSPARIREQNGDNVIWEINLLNFPIIVLLGLRLYRRVKALNAEQSPL